MATTTNYNCSYCFTAGGSTEAERKWPANSFTNNMRCCCAANAKPQTKSARFNRFARLTKRMALLKRGQLSTATVNAMTSRTNSPPTTAGAIHSKRNAKPVNNVYMEFGSTNFNRQLDNSRSQSTSANDIAKDVRCRLFAQLKKPVALLKRRSALPLNVMTCSRNNSHAGAAANKLPKTKGKGSGDAKFNTVTTGSSGNKPTTTGNAKNKRVRFCLVLGQMQNQHQATPTTSSTTRKMLRCERRLWDPKAIAIPVGDKAEVTVPRLAVTRRLR